MNAEAIISLINAGVQAIQTGYDLYNQTKAVLSEEDQAKIKKALADAQDATNVLRPQVDAALEEASKKP